MWSYNIGDAKIEGGDQIKVFTILNGHENIDPNIVLKIRQVKELAGMTSR